MTTSVLDAMAAGIMTRKKEASKGLTPVGAERTAETSRPPIIAVSAPLPNDVGVFLSNEALRDHAKELRRFAADAIKIADGLDVMIGGAEPEPVKVDVKAAEKAADAKAKDPAFADRYRKLQKDAEDQTYKGPSLGTMAVELGEMVKELDAATTGWVCPTHGLAIDKISPKDRHYRGCPTCSEFER